MTIRYPDLSVKLIGKDGNAYAILGVMMAALRRTGASEDEVKEFREQAMSGDYDHLLATCMEWVNVT